MRVSRLLAALCAVVLAGAIVGCGAPSPSTSAPSGKPGPAAGPAPSGETALSQDIELGAQAKLKGYTLSKTADGKTEITLQWECLKATPDTYTIFVHVFPNDRSALPTDRAKSGYFNLDNRPKVPTSKWQVGQTYVSVHRAALPAGTYRPAVGMYRVASDGKTLLRLPPTAGGSGSPEGQSVAIGSITVP